MSTHTTDTTTPARSEVVEVAEVAETARSWSAWAGRASGAADGDAFGRAPRGWALSGLLAGLAGAGAIASSMAVTAVYDPALEGDAVAINEALGDQVPQMLAFHLLGMASAILLLVFSAGLFRRLRAAAPADSIAPLVATFGAVGTAFVLLLGTGLDTEFIFAVGREDLVVPEAAVFFNHWIGTIPWCWGLLGLSGVALFPLSRAGGVPRWLGVVGLLGGGLTLLLGVSPLQYMAGMVAPLGLIVVALGFLVGDRAFRGRA
ncbi:hypothetical protein [Nocardioides sp. GY 10113]|uniref:hypothetical protein n=1 Tax=Nocardioides sp. GY 10113 TaxID=2569761 RepID=UPI00197F3F8B|nr:hypothetical protein [Nocardioides sp. GY 10113]